MLWIITLTLGTGFAYSAAVLAHSYRGTRAASANDALPSSSVPQAPPLPAAPDGVAKPALPDGPVKWNFAGGDNIFGFGSGSAGFWVVRYRLQGVNQSGQQLTSVRAYVIPKNTGRRIDLQFEIDPNQWIDTDKTYGVPPGAPVVLAARIPGSSRDEGVATVEEYLDRYGGFTFVFECAEAPKFTHEFAYADVKEMLVKSRDRHMAPYQPVPTIRPKLE